MTETSKPKFFNITFLRHGESVGNAESRWQGQADFPLTDRGREQAQALAARLQAEEVVAGYSSPARRARTTAEALSARFAITFVECADLWEAEIWLYSAGAVLVSLSNDELFTS